MSKHEDGIFNLKCAGFLALLISLPFHLYWNMDGQYNQYGKYLYLLSAVITIVAFIINRKKIDYKQEESKRLILATGAYLIYYLIMFFQSL